MNTLINEISEKNKETFDEVKVRSDYVQMNIEAFQLMRARDYLGAEKKYEDCLETSRRLKDDYKYIDSLSNLAVVKFFNGKISRSLHDLEEAYRKYAEADLSRTGTDNLSFLCLYMKILGNTSLANLATGKTDEALEAANSIVDIVKRSVRDNYHKEQLVKYVNHLFFRTDSLLEIPEAKLLQNSENSEADQAHRESVGRILTEMHRFLREGDTERWVSCLEEEKDKLKEFKDYNGFIFATYNLYVVLFSHQLQDETYVIQKVSALCRVLNSGNEERDVAAILDEAKAKLAVAGKIYRKLLSLENEVSKLEILEPKANSNIFAKIFLKNTLKNLSPTDSQLRNQIELTLKLVESGDVSLEHLDVSEIDPELTESLNLLFDNLLKIKERSFLKEPFLEFKFATLKYRTARDLAAIKNEKFNEMCFKKYQLICEGDILTKINYSSSGKKQHFYHLVPQENSIRVYRKKGDKSFYSIPMKTISAIFYGLSTNNVRKKFKSAEFNNPWRFFSLQTGDRSVDLYLDDSQLWNWFYGLSYYFRETGTPHKIQSVFSFTTTKLKLMLLQRMRQDFKKKEISVDSNPNLLRLFIKGKISLTSDDIFFHQLPFIKVFLIYVKIYKQQF